MVWVDHFLALQPGFVHPSVARVARAVFDGVVVLLLGSLPRIIPWANKVDTMSAEVVIAYREGITGSHFAVGGMDQIMIPLQVSSVMVGVLRLSTATFLIRNNLICSWMSVPSM